MSEPPLPLNEGQHSADYSPLRWFFAYDVTYPHGAGKADKSAVLKVVTNPKGVLSDKLRLVAVWLLTAESLPSQGDFQEIEQVLRGAGADLEALNYLKRLRNLSLTGSQRSFAVPSQNTTAASSQVRK